MWNMTGTVYVNRFYRASIGSIAYDTTDGTLTVHLNSAASLTGGSVSFYYPYAYQVINTPTLRVQFSNGTVINDAISFYS